MLTSMAANARTQTHSFSWAEVRDKFQESNPTMRAAQIGIDESRAQEITAYLRPNPELTGAFDQMNFFSTQPPPSGGPAVYSPFAYAFPSASISYLHERQHKRELRLESAQKGTAIAVSQYADQERNLLFNLRTAFVQTLQQKALLDLTKESLTFYNRLLDVSNERLKAGDIARVDFQRLVLQRVQFETDVQTALVNLRTAKIQLLMLLNDRTPVEQFDVTGPFDFTAELRPLEEFRNIALEGRPDLKAAAQNVELAKITYKLSVANGSTDPTFSIWYSHNPSFANSF